MGATDVGAGGDSGADGEIGAEADGAVGVDVGVGLAQAVTKMQVTNVAPTLQVARKRDIYRVYHELKVGRQ